MKFISISILTSSIIAIISTLLYIKRRRLSRKLTIEESIALKKGQQIMTDMFKEFDNICCTNGLKYWCVCGTLLGAVRHKGWIHHDADIDVAMLEPNYKKLQKNVQEKLSKDYWFQDKYYKSNIDKIRYLYAQYDDYKCQDWHNGIQLDIFVLKEEKDMLICTANDDEVTTHNRNIIFLLKELVFEKIKVYVPNQYKQYLINQSGAYPPPKLPIHKQYPHEGRISFTIPTWVKKKYPQLYPI